MLGAVTARLPHASLPARGRSAAPAQRSEAVSVPREVLKFSAAGLVAAIAVAGGSFWAVSHAATAEAINTAQVVTQLDGTAVVQPLLSAKVLAGDARALAALDAAVRTRVLSSRVVRVKIWTEAGRVVYSDATALIGQTYALGDEELNAFSAGTVASDDSDLNKPENRFERSYGSLLEVYLPVRAANGTRLLFETYQPDAAIAADRNRVWGGLLPPLLAGISAFFILQIPLSLRLARRLERSGRDRAALLQRAIDSSERERHRVAADLHDGPVQNLTAVSISLGAMAATLDREESVDRAQVSAGITTASTEARNAIRELRSLMIEIAPPDLETGGLGDALQRLLASAREAGLRTDVHMPERLDLPPDATSLLYRAAQESVRNVIKHARATSVTVTVMRTAHAVTLDVVDDGCGFDAQGLRRRRSEGHVGMALLEERVSEAGAHMRVDSAPGEGTTVHLSIDV